MSKLLLRVEPYHNYESSKSPYTKRTTEKSPVSVRPSSQQNSKANQGIVMNSHSYARGNSKEYFRKVNIENTAMFDRLSNIYSRESSLLLDIGKKPSKNGRKMTSAKRQVNQAHTSIPRPQKPERQQSVTPRKSAGTLSRGRSKTDFLKQQEKDRIQEQNLFLLKRLTHMKPVINKKQFNKDFINHQEVGRRISRWGGGKDSRPTSETSKHRLDTYEDLLPRTSRAEIMSAKAKKNTITEMESMQGRINSYRDIARSKDKSPTPQQPAQSKMIQESRRKYHSQQVMPPRMKLRSTENLNRYSETVLKQENQELRMLTLPSDLENAQFSSSEKKY